MPLLTEDDDLRQSVRPRRRGMQGRVSTDSQTLLIRRGVALGGSLLLLLMLLLIVRGCLDSRKKDALKAYNRSVATLVHESDKQIGQPFFELLSMPTQSQQDLQTSISGYRVQAETQLRQAKKFSVPAQMQAAQRSFLITLQFRRDGLDAVAERIRSALSDNPDSAGQAIQDIAAEMQLFLASDVTYQARVVPLMRKALKDSGLSTAAVPQSQFLAGIEWLSPATVAQRLGQQAALIRKNRRNETPTPGRHGTGLVSVMADTTRLQIGSANRLPASTNAFVVKFNNEGDSDEFGIKVQLTIEGAGKPIRLERTVDTVAKGASADTTFQLTSPPPTGVPVTIKVNVEALPGEKNIDNNKAEYQALFTR